MFVSRLQQILRVVLVTSALVPGPMALAQGYPSKPIHLVVGYPAGGPADIAARLVAEQLSAQLPQRTVVDNKPGAGGAIASGLVASAPADGYTLLLSGNNIAISQLMTAAPAYDANDSFVHLAQVAALPTGVFVNANSPHRSFADLLAHLKANPARLTYASGGNGTPSHLAMELLKRSAGVEVRHVPYKGTPPALADLMGGHVDMLVTSIAGPMEQVKAGKLRLLAVSSPQRLPDLPQVPAVAELLPGYSFETWLALSAPRGLPAAVSDRLSAAIDRALREPALIARMAQTGLNSSYLPAADTTAKMARELKAFREVVREAGIRAE